MRHLTVSEAAEALQLSVPTIKRYLYEGKLHSIKLPGGQHRIPQSEIDRLLSPDPEAVSTGLSGLSTTDIEQRVGILEQWVTELQAEIERLQATLEVLGRFCARIQQKEGGEPIMAPQAQEMHRVVVLGPGCKKCHALYKATERILGEWGREDISLEHIKHLDDITAFGPVLTPALAIDDQIVVSGRVPSESALRKLLSQYLG
ncbi:MAG: MTH895/ArsE family thioredoxin-like protein [Candidatus Zipacnadales bacterium]